MQIPFRPEGRRFVEEPIPSRDFQRLRRTQKPAALKGSERDEDALKNAGKALSFRTDSSKPDPARRCGGGHTGIWLDSGEIGLPELILGGAGTRVVGGRAGRSKRR